MDLKLSIYKFLQTIPHGKIVSYKIIANKFNIHPRYVGKIMNQNQHPDIYPCYKVIRSDGSLGGYGGGCENKIKRLESDGIQILNGKIAKEYFWKI